MIDQAEIDLINELPAIAETLYVRSEGVYCVRHSHNDKEIDLIEFSVFKDGDACCVNLYCPRTKNEVMYELDVAGIANAANWINTVSIQETTFWDSVLT